MANALIVQSDGSIVAAGTSFPEGASSTGPAFALARYDATGEPDTDFGTQGRVTTNFPGGYREDVVFAVQSQPNGKLVAAGSSGDSFIGRDFALARYNPDGSIDVSFGGSGTVTTEFGGNDVARALALQPDGNIVALDFNSGSSSGGDTKFALARYLGGSMDTTPPVLSVPSDVVVNAARPTGAIVGYQVTTTDVDDPNPTLICNPPSDSMFALGTTLVTCTATDFSGNEASASFSVHVKGAAEQLADLQQAAASVGPGKKPR